ncbi:hypothetical protein PHLGIDRAFT_34739 [Phlebiopsis gigantea 11061_1 CR5-6]|uniref:BCAS3 WD40 domain-containing protein n=1 Tax=Phlebiopsis gigantea (strain 11061_1 CR5-6) TaxID=745531 RepID=A0A0C3NU72_PHLG1|nr:hypothetical protein PHLGIDRAFT_34739 [Phlebiopsis gigantea 11061_1 CR5-6]
MPVKSKRNGLSKKLRNETAHIMYSHSPSEDTPSTSAASSPPEHIPTLGSPAFTAVFDPGPPVAPEQAQEEVVEEYMHAYEEETGFELEDETILPVPPPGAHVYRDRSPAAQMEECAARPELLVDVDVPGPRERGHVRSPVLAREPSTLESFSRTIRGYVPSSIPIPTAVPTPPRVSRPLSFGSFLSPSRTSSASRSRGPNPESEPTKRRGSDVAADNRAAWRAQQPAPQEADAVFSLDEEVMSETVQQDSATRYPGAMHGEDVVWARWDTVEDGSATTRIILLVGYRTGMQVWDCSNLGSISEVLNLSGPSWGDIKIAAVLPNPDTHVAQDEMESCRPLIGMIRSATPEASEFVVYSLRTHQVVKSIPLPSLVAISVSREFIVLPTFTLFNRLLAYVSPPPRLDSPHEVPSRTPRSTSLASLEDNALKFPLNQAELGAAASKFGVSVLSGMKVLGGIAYSAARAGVSAAATAAERRYSAEVGAPPVVPGKFFSRSAPAASGGGEEQRDPTHGGQRAHDTSPTLDPPVVDRQLASEDTHHITVVDLEPLRTSANAGPAVVAEFFVGKEQPISLLQFSQDGTSLMVATSGGQTMKVFQVITRDAAIGWAAADQMKIT